MSLFVGLPQLNSTLIGVVAFVDSDGQPFEPSNTPAYRVYGPNGLLTSMVGTLSKRDTGSISGASKANPGVITTSAAHNLKDGMRVTISGVGGMTELNGNTYTVTVLTTTTFSLGTNTSSYTTYTSGGSFWVTGLYYYSLSLTLANGFLQGKTFHVNVTATVDSVVRTQMDSFVVS